MDRRTFMVEIGASLLWTSLATAAQPSLAVRRIGVLSPGPPLTPAQLREAWQPLRDIGWIEGENLIFERRWANGNADLLRPLAEELVRLNVELIATIGMPATLAAKNATARIPIVMLSAGDPVGSGLVASLARPGGNVTGYSTLAPELAYKRIALLREVAPTTQRVGLLFNPTNYLWDFSREQNERACKSFGLEPIFIEATSAEQLKAAMEELARRRGQGLVVGDDELFYQHRFMITSAAVAHRWPSSVAGRGMLEAGGLMSYDAILADQLVRMVTYIDRILRGAKPAELPIEQPTRFRMMFNLKTANALGVVIPQSLLLRADDVIR
jgi:putative ABC transport system substrate-binding protein